MEPLSPWLLAVVALVAIAVWSSTGPIEGLQPRVPGMDRAGDTAAETAETASREGVLVRSGGQPADLPGAWPFFRGPLQDGISRAPEPAPEPSSVELARSWPPEGPPVLWRIDVGEGYAGAAVRDGRVYLIDYDQERGADAIRCLSLADGEEIWRYSYPVKIKRNHGMSRTVPSVTEKHVVTMGPKCHVACLDAETGERRWFLDLVRDFGTKVPQWYAGQCPLVDSGRVILAPGGPEALLMALNIEDGTAIWRTPNPRRWDMTHSSVAKLAVDGTEMYVYCAKKGVVGVAADDGRLLWETEEWKISIATVPMPLPVGDGRIFLSGGYNAGSLMLQVVKDAGGFAARTLFRLKPQVFGAAQQTPIFHQGHIFGVRPDGQLVCLDLEGNIRWESGAQQTFGLGPFMIAGDLILALDDHARLAMAEASVDSFRLLAEAQIIEGGHEAWGPMALAGSRLILRDLTRMVCLELGRS